MISVPFGPNGEPLDAIVPPRPMLFTGVALFVFDSAEEYAQWIADNYPIPPPPEPEIDATA